MKLDKIVNLTKKIFFDKSKYFYLHYVIFFHQIFMNVFNIINISSITIYTKIIDISIKTCFFILSVDKSLELVPKHNGVTTISESFALNF